LYRPFLYKEACHKPIESMIIKVMILIYILALSVLTSHAQVKPGTQVTAPLHAMKVDYPTPYEPTSTLDIKKTLDRIFNYLNAVTPAQMVNKITGAPVNDLSTIDTNTILKQGDFRLTSYEWGVTYSGILVAAETIGDLKYSKYVKQRFTFLADWIPAEKKLQKAGAYLYNHYPLQQPIETKALDGAGAICAAMIIATTAGLNNNLRPVIDHLINFVGKEEVRLPDGTLAKMRPQKNTLWLDDLYMGVPALAQIGKLTGDKKYFDDAVEPGEII